MQSEADSFLLLTVCCIHAARPSYTALMEKSDGPPGSEITCVCVRVCARCMYGHACIHSV